MAKKIDEGTYGCIFRPGINCDGTANSDKYISKIQLKMERTMNEPIIGKLITDKIKHASRYFAPALSVCKATLTKINKNELGKCEAIKFKKATDEFVSIKVKYVGKDNLEENMDKHQVKDKVSFLLHMMDTHQYLAEAISELEKQQIVHHDIKSNNVMYSDSQNVPIIIDFGVSFQLKDLYKEEALQDIFFSAYEKYPPWCLEITFIAAIIKDPGWETKKVDLKILGKHLSTFIEKNPVISLITNSVEHQTGMERSWTNYLKTFENDTGKIAVNRLLETWNTWDLYSIHVMFISFMHTGKWLKRRHHPCVKPYINYVISQIQLVPKERDDPATTVEKIEKIRGKIKRSDFVDFVKEQTNF